MKIAFLNLHQNVVNRGLETFVRELSKKLSGRHEVEIISGNVQVEKRWPLLWRFFLDPNGITVFLFTFKILPKILKEKYGVVIPGNGGWQPALIRLATWFYGGNMVISGQSGIGWDDKNNLWCFPDCFVALSHYAKKWAKGVNPFVKVEYIPNGCDLTKFTPQGEKLKLDLKKPIILCVGALTSTKRIDLVIQAVSRLKNVSLLVVGEGELKGYLEEMGRKLLKNRFKLMSLPFEKMQNVYRAADVFTLVSEQFYSFEISLVEAMATGVPVVANDDPIRREVVSNAGILVNPTDIGHYTKALKKALSDNWGSKPRKQAEKFSWDEIAHEYETLFLNLLK